MPQIDRDQVAAPAARTGPQLAFIQGLRGIAALLVVLFHLYSSTPVAGNLVAVLPRFVDGALQLGFLGVQLFFVISGYVIALSLHGRMTTPREGLRFFVRRQLRLDPPYWVAIVLSVASALILRRLRPDAAVVVPSVGTIVAHVFYLQDLLRLHPIAGVFWTLCYEIQFYLFLVTVLLVAARLRLSMRSLGWWLLPVYLASLGDWWGLLPRTENFALELWFAFFLGVAVFLHGRGQFSSVQLLAYLLPLLALLIVSPASPNCIADVAAVTVLLIALIFLLAQRGNGMRDWLSARFWGYFGSISYSLYLMHAIIGIRALKLLVHPQDSVVRSALFYAAALLLSIGASDLLYRLVEKPSVRLSHRFRWQENGRAPRRAASSLLQ